MMTSYHVVSKLTTLPPEQADWYGAGDALQASAYGRANGGGVWL